MSERENKQEMVRILHNNAAQDQKAKNLGTQTNSSNMLEQQNHVYLFKRKNRNTLGDMGVWI